MLFLKGFANFLRWQPSPKFHVGLTAFDSIELFKSASSRSYKESYQPHLPGKAKFAICKRLPVQPVRTHRALDSKSQRALRAPRGPPGNILGGCLAFRGVWGVWNAPGVRGSSPGMF